MGDIQAPANLDSAEQQFLKVAAPTDTAAPAPISDTKPEAVSTKDPASVEDKFLSVASPSAASVEDKFLSVASPSAASVEEPKPGEQWQTVAKEISKLPKNTSSADIDKLTQLLTPEQKQKLLSAVPEYPHAEEVYRDVWGAIRSGAVKNSEGPGFWAQLGQAAKSFTKGTLKLGGFLDAPEPGASEEEIKQYAQRGLDLAKSANATAAETPEAINWTLAGQAAAGPDLFGARDWVSEKLGLSTPEDSYQRWRARKSIESARAQYEKETPNVYSRWVRNPLAVSAIDNLIRLSGAKDADPAVTRKMAEDISNEIAADQAPIDQDVALSGSFLDPTGLNLGELGVAFKGMEAAKQIPGAIRAVTTTKEAQQAYNAKKIADAVEKGSKTGIFTKSADKIATGLENLTASVEDFQAAHPFATKALSFIPGAVVGASEDKEHPVLGALLGGTIESSGLHLLKGVKLGKIAAAAPRVLADLGEARALSAGTGRTFEFAGTNPEFSPATRTLFAKGRQMDRLAKFMGDYGHDMPDMVAAGVATGILNNEDPEETLSGIGQGIFYGALHKSFAKILGKDYASAAAERNRKDKANYIALQQLDPETRDNISKLQSWDGVVAKAQSDVAEAQSKYSEAVSAKNPDDAAEWGERLKQRQAMLDRMKQANVATREAFASHVADTVRAGVEASNGPFREGNKTVSIAVLTPEQIRQKLTAQNPTKTPEQIQSIIDSGHFYSGAGKGIEPGANIPDALRPSAEGMVFNPLKPTVVLNTEHIARRANELGHSFQDAFSHELGHALDNIPEWQELFDNRELFDTVYKDLDGTEYRPATGVFSDKKLADLYWNSYLKDIKKRPDEKTEEEAKKRWAIENGHWDTPNDRLNEHAVAEYMKPEVRADLHSKGLTGSTFDNLDSWQLHLLDWSRTKAQNSLARRAVEGFLGVGGRDPYDTVASPATGATFSPELLSAYRNALRSFRNLHGQVSQSTESGRVMPMISPTKMIKDPSLRQKYGRDSGLFKTQFVAVVYDKDGKAVGHTVVQDPLASEGLWGNTEGQVIQRSGYGALPAELGNAQIPEGGSIRISREIVMHPDGETPVMLSRKEQKALAKTRSQIIRDAIDGAYQGEPNGFRAVSEDGLTYRGYFTPAQISAIRALPEQIVPAKIKDTILRFNDLLASGDGSRMLIDYAARLDDRGRPVSFSPKTYDLVPIGMHFSKGGNFLITAVSVSRLLDKLNLWGDRLPGRLSLWGGDKEAFFREFATKYLPNHLEKWTNPDLPADMTPEEREKAPKIARPGETALDPDPEIAKQKKNVFNDFLNLTSNEFRDLNPDRTVIPRRKGDPRGKSPDRTIMSVRADSVADLLESSAHKIPISYELQKKNYLPARESKPVEDTRKEENNPILKALGAITATHVPADQRTPYAQPVRAANEDVRRISENYVKNAGMEYRPHGQAVPVNEELAKRIADHYEEAKNDPSHPEVKKAYTALASEVVNQWKAFEKAGYTATPWTGKGQPYANSAEMMKDVRDNKHLYYFQTKEGYGESGITAKMRAENPMLQDSGVNFNGADNVPVNDVFRVVHDIVGHGANGYEFGPKGEFNAYLEHSRMFSDAAKPALAAETLAQNSWVNFGPHLRDEAGNIAKKGEKGYVPVTERPFAEQKNIALPKEFIDAAESQAGTKAQGPSFLPAKKLTAQHPSEEKEGSVGGDLDLVHFGAYGIKSADPKKLGKGSATGIDRAGLPKTYFYLNGTPYEDAIKSQTPYLAKVDGNSIYDLDKDPLGLQQTNREKMDKAIKDAGFAGYFSAAKDGQGFSAVAMFKPTKLTEAQPEDVFSKAEAKRLRAAGGPEIDYAAQDAAFEAQQAKGFSFLPAKKLDEAHSKAIESGDMEEAQRLVDERARQAGFDPIGFWHASKGDEEWTETQDRPIYLAKDEEVAQSMAEEWNEAKPFYTNIPQEKIKQVGEGEASFIEDKYDPRIKSWKKEGYEAAMGQMFGTKKESDQELLVFNPVGKVKSADPATYDDNGKLIPLSQRFDTSNPDIRYLPAKKGVDAGTETDESLPTDERQTAYNARAQGAGQQAGGQSQEDRNRLLSGLASVARGSQSSGTEGVPGTSGTATRKEVEEAALRKHAEENGLMVDPEPFHKQWQLDGSEAGGEHQVSFPPGPDVIKRTPNPYYPTWGDYFDAVQVHNTLFPRAALTFRGFQDVENGGTDIDGTKWPSGLYSEVSQPFLKIKRGLTVPETDAMMQEIGFRRTLPMEYVNDDLGIKMKDLHGMNAVMLEDENGKEFPYVIDSTIVPTEAKEEQPRVMLDGHVVVTNPEADFVAKPKILAQFLPASQRIKLEDYADTPMFALPADRMGVGTKYVGPIDNKKKLSIQAQGGPEHMTLLNHGVWAFSNEGPASTFANRVDKLAEKHGTDSVLVAVTLQSPINHLKNPTGQLGYVEAMEQARDTKNLTQKQLDAQIKEMSGAIVASKGKDMDENVRSKWKAINSFSKFADAVRAKKLNFGDMEPFLTQMQRSKLPISAKELGALGLLPHDIARDLSTDWIFDLPNDTVVGLFEVKKGTRPTQDNTHYSYPWSVAGKPIGFLKDIYHVKGLTTHSGIQKSTSLAWPLQRALPELDNLKKALSDLKPIVTYR